MGVAAAPKQHASKISWLLGELLAVSVKMAPPPPSTTRVQLVYPCAGLRGGAVHARGRGAAARAAHLQPGHAGCHPAVDAAGPPAAAGGCAPTSCMLGMLHAAPLAAWHGRSSAAWPCWPLIMVCTPCWLQVELLQAPQLSTHSVPAGARLPCPCMLACCAASMKALARSEG